MIGIPCKHVVPYVHHMKMNLEDLCYSYCFVKTFRKTYSKVVHLLLEAELDLK